MISGLALQLAACGLGWIDNQSGGDNNLPTRSAGPYTKLARNAETPADEPHVVSVFQVHLRDPAAIRIRDSGFRLWFGYEDDPALPESEIWMAELASLDQLPVVGPILALPADQEWEQSRVGAPSIVELDDDRLVMFYQGGVDTIAIGRAESSDGGMTWTKNPGNPVLAGLGEPTVARLPEGSWLLYGTRSDLMAIFRATSLDGVSWQIDEEPVIQPRSHLPEAYDRYAVSNPCITIRQTLAGDLHFGLFINGLDRDDEDGTTSVGWAGSFDGIQWQRFSNPDDAVLEPGTTSENGPSVVLDPDGGVMFFSEQKQGTQSIAAATHP